MLGCGWGGEDGAGEGEEAGASGPEAGKDVDGRGGEEGGKVDVLRGGGGRD